MVPMKTGFYHIPRNASLKDRFDASFIPEPNSGCWLWVGATTTHRNFTRGMISRRNKNEYAARISFELHKGPIPVGRIVCHRCNNAMCVNPEHLYPGTYQSNTDDMMRAGRHRPGRGGGWGGGGGFHGAYAYIAPPPGSPTHCRHGHSLQGEGVYLHPSSRSVICRKCKRLANLRAQTKSRAARKLARNS